MILLAVPVLQIRDVGEQLDGVKLYSAKYCESSSKRAEPRVALLRAKAVVRNKCLMSGLQLAD